MGEQPFAPRRAALLGQRRIIGVGAAIDPVLKAVAAGALESLALPLAIFEGDHPPAAGLEDIVEAAEHAVGCRGIQRLAVIIDDPPAIAQVMLVAFDQAFIDLADRKSTRLNSSH